MADLPDGIDAAFLEDALRRAGALEAGAVSRAQVIDCRDTILSRIFRLRLDYLGAAAGAPATLFLKTSLPPDRRPAWNGGVHEVAFYRQVAPATPTGLLPRCFDAAAHDDGAWRLLLEDLADTHEVATQWPLPPNLAQARRIVRARARFHAAWWDDERLGRSVGRWLSPAEVTEQQRGLPPLLAGFVERNQDRVPAEHRLLLERLFDAAPRLAARYLAHRHMTIVQGDGHFWNAFLSRRHDGVTFFDWDGWSIDIGSDDLAYLIAMHWYPDRRRRLERGLLDDYHEALLAHGVRDYSRQALADDYRLSVLWLTTRALWQESVGIPPVIWWNNYERIMMAVDDLDCRELLG